VTVADSLARAGAAPAQEVPARGAARLREVRVDRASGLVIGRLRIGRQDLRVGIRPASERPSAPVRPPLLLFNGIGANLELTAPLLHELADREAIASMRPAPAHRPRRCCPTVSGSWRASRRVSMRSAAVLSMSSACRGAGGLAQFAAQYPRRCRRPVLACATSMGVLMLPGKPSVLWQMISPRRYWDKDHLRKIAPQIYGGALRHDPAALRDHARTIRGGTTYGYALQLLALAGWTSLPLLWRIRQPTLVLAGRDDPLVPLANARWLARLLPRGRLEVMDCGHLFLVTRASETARLIQHFLGAVAPA
jgi:poly(3-hydroxyalkanoate) depolymerase